MSVHTTFLCVVPLIIRCVCYTRVLWTFEYQKWVVIRRPPLRISYTGAVYSHVQICIIARDHLAKDVFSYGFSCITRNAIRTIKALSLLYHITTYICKVLSVIDRICLHRSVKHQKLNTWERVIRKEGECRIRPRLYWHLTFMDHILILKSLMIQSSYQMLV